MIQTAPALGGVATGDLFSLAGVVVMLVGLWMVWHRHRHRWDVEEALKDGKLTEQEARRRIAWIKWRPVGVIGAELLMLAGAIAMLGR